MAVDVLLGLQWGDEGKGKIVDVLAPKYEVIARFQGGPNAGHTLEFDGFKHVLHQIPSGIFRKHSSNIIGNGVVLDPIIFKKEIDGLAKYNLDIKSNLSISKKASIIIPTHRMLDAAYETAKGTSKIGSTLKGIGPTYTDKISRVGLRVGDILSVNFAKKYNELVDKHKVILDLYQFEYDLTEAESSFFEAVEFMKTFNIVDSEYVVNAAIADGKKILAEGAQGSLLDVDFGSYPFVTSSNTITAGACTGLGIAPNKIGEVFGIFKAYATRVGSGPFPTELDDEIGEKMRKEGNEYGSTTGRSRRCGWIDLPALKYTMMINGVSQLVMMKVDVLNIFDEIKACVAYKMPDGSITDQIPYDINDIKIEPVYETLPGWSCSLEGMRNLNELPENLTKYINFLEENLGLPINFVSTGPDREAVVLKGALA
ncbi:MAG: adenylosuccinate synthase [Bacteroidota bacterium]